MDYSARAKREQDKYNEGTLDRDKLNKYIAHANILLYRQIINDAKKYLLRANGGNVLEIGCQSWKSWIDDAGINPSELHCINISKSELSVGSDLAKHSRLKPIFQIMDAHDMKFNNATFDIIFGEAILHHLNIDKVMIELKRVLKPGGFILFAEPLNINPVAKIIRLLTPKARTVDEHAFTIKDFRTIREHFNTSEKFYQLFSLPVSGISGLLFKDESNPIMKFSDFIDRNLLRIAPFLKYYYRSSLVIGNKKPAN